MQKLLHYPKLLVFALLLSILPSAGWAQGGGNSVTVSGIVTSADDGLPLVGVSIVAGPSAGVSSLSDGQYSIRTAPGTVLRFQYLGYKSVEYTVPAGQSQVTYNLAMQSDAQAVDEVVVVAYGVRKKGTISGSVSTVKAKEINDVPAASFDQALQGKAPGLSVMTDTGEPGVAASFRIRGVNSINSGTEPLFILDGMQISSGDFSALNPNDIESVSVLKDASSTSIYGARAANGVVVITTKRGSIAENGKVQFRMQLGFSDIAYGNWDQMNTAERIQYEQEIGLDANKNYEMLRNIDVDWHKIIYQDNAPLRNYEVSVSGATPNINYFVSGGYYRQKGISLDSDFERYTFRSNFETTVTKWLKLGTNSTFSYENYHTSIDGDYTLQTPISASRFMLPYWNPYRADGSIASVSDGSWLGEGENPLEWLMNNKMDTKSYKVISNVFADFRILDGLTFRSQGGLNFYYSPASSSSNPSYMPNNGVGYYAKQDAHGVNLSWTNTLTYLFDIDNSHNFNILLGHEMVDNQDLSNTFTTQGQTSDKLLNISSATTTTAWSNSLSASSYLSFFGRAEYNYEHRYYVDLSVRGDASSRFGRDNRWATFWSLGLMWDLRNEAFMKDRAEWLTTAQIALSTGTSGNSSIPNYEHLALVSGGAQYDVNAAMVLSSLGNEDLTWEEIWTTNLALHLGFFNRVNLDLELYNKRTSDMLMQVPVRFATGQGFKWDNIGAMTNRGFEFNLDADVIHTGDFVWNVSANAGYNYNRIDELYAGKDQYEFAETGLKLVVGREYGEFYLNRFAGVNPINGDALWYDKDGNVTTEYRDADKVFLGKSRFAPWSGGFGTSVSWKGISVSTLFTWVADRWMINNDRWFDESNGTYQQYNQSKRLLYNRWKKPGDIADIPRHGVVAQMDDRFLEDASFLRWKNLNVAYRFPKSLLQKTRFISELQIYFQAQNLLTFTEFTGLDPESDMNVYRAKYPMSRQFTFGLEITF